jgi:hypothetical protein
MLLPATPIQPFWADFFALGSSKGLAESQNKKF